MSRPRRRHGLDRTAGHRLACAGWREPAVGRGQHRARSAQHDGAGKGAAMGRAALCMRAAALLAVAGMFFFLAEGISADNDIAEAVAARVLEPTEVVAEIPEEYNTLFELQWGGGSLYQLKGRLATMGCMANTIWLYDNAKWHPYNQYQISSTFASNVEFQNQYAEFIPMGTLWADCFRMCEFKYNDDIQARTCEEFEFLREHNFFNILPYSISDTSFCTNDFNPLVKEKVLPRLPLHPDTCIVRQEHEKVRGYAMNFLLDLAAREHTLTAYLYLLYTLPAIIYHPICLPQCNKEIRDDYYTMRYTNSAM